ncbi:RNA-directed DNA polymerase, eukaryota, reverse transcriptase zinc-binding domain protein [Tanacetum coccineum]
MSRLANWKDVVDKFKHKFSTWNSRVLSVGKRLTLIKAVLGNLPTYYISLYKVPSAIERNLESMRNNFFIGGDLEDGKMTWVTWKKCLASKEHGGLGHGSIFALNIALMFKWIWRFRVSCEDLWIKATKHLTEKGIDILSLCKRKVGDKSSISVWDDDWCGDRPLKLQFPRVYALDDAKSYTVVERLKLLDWFSVFRRPPRGCDEILQYTALRACTSQVTLSSQKDGWIWSHGGSDDFFVASAHGFIDDVILDVDYVATRWNRLVPTKVNVFFWRLNLNRIPTRAKLDRRGIDIGSFCA